MFSAEQRVAVVTGSNRGVGLAVVRGLCKQFQGDVYLTSRDEQRGREAVQLLEAEGLSPKFHQLDITNTGSVQRLKKFVVDKYGGIDVLVNNAGLAYKIASTAPVLEQATVTSNCNFTGTLNMMKAFVPIARPHARIVNVSSMTGKLSRLTNKSLQERFANPSLTLPELVSLVEELLSDAREGKQVERGWGNSFYAVTKVCVTAMTKIYAREIVGKDDILINACCPGWVKTDMGGDKAPLTPDQGAETPILCSLLPPGSPNGEFWEKKVVSSW